MKLTNEIYFFPEANLTYMSSSQLKSFMDCEAKAYAAVCGEWQNESTKPLLVGSYVDAYFEGSLDKFQADHPEIFLKNGGLKAEYRQAEDIIARIERDGKMMQYLNGEKQAVMTGEIAGIPFKIKIDAYHPGKAIVDLKIMRSYESIWNPLDQRRLPWWEAWRYDIQGAIYREIERQNRGADAAPLPFYLVSATKEAEPDIEIAEIAPERLDAALEMVTRVAPHFVSIKRGEIEPTRCEHCDYCRHTKVITDIALYGAEE